MKDVLKVTAFLFMFCLLGTAYAMTSSTGQVSFGNLVFAIGFGLCVGWLVFLPFAIHMASEAEAPETTNPTAS